MTRTLTEEPATTSRRGGTLRSRLLSRLIGLILILGLSIFIFAVEGTSDLSSLNKTLLGIALFAGGALLALSIVSLVQTNLLVPLLHIKNWAERVRAGRHTDPVPSPDYPALASLAEDLNKIASRVTPGNSQVNDNVTLDAERDSLRILYEVVSSINTAHGLDDLLTRFMYTLKRTTQAKAAAIWVGQNTGNMELTASSGINEAFILGDRPEVCRSLYERAMTEGKIWVEETLEKCEQIAGQRFFEEGHYGLVSIPMRYRGKVTGVINLFADTSFISQIDSFRPLLTSISHHLSIAIERAYSEEENRRHLINDERTRIAHDLHDSLAQSLASIRYQVRVLDETLHQGDESTTWQQLERIENSLDEANTELRGLIANFRAPVYKRGLIEAIEQIVSQFRNETRIKTYLQKEWSNRSFSKDVEIQILRIIQEALWNIRKHSEANTVRIMLGDNTEGQCYILIEDDGVGINKQVYGTPGEHIGLTIMQERAARAGGELRVESEPGEGTRIVLTLIEPDTTETLI